MRLEPDDRAGREYWDELWEDRSGHLPPAVDPALPGLNNYVNRAFHSLFEKWLGPQPRGRQLLEIGCAGSAWLPYFHRAFRLRVTGLDYSEIGCIHAREVLAAAGVPGTVLQANLFDPPEELIASADIVVSFGVAEHFEDTASCLRAFARFLVSEGRLITVVPNMLGVPGFLQRRFDRATWDIHVPLNPSRLARAHREAGLEVLECHYFLAVNLCVLKTPRVPDLLHGFTRRSLSGLSKAVWLLDRAGLPLPPNRLFSPYVVTLATRPPVEAS